MRLYLVTDRHATNGRSLTDVVEAALRGGVDAVQLREKDLLTRDLLALARELRAITRRHRAKLLINDRIDVALAVGADGVHLPADSFAIEDARRLLGADAVIGVSTHSVDEVRRAADDGADYIVFGPIYDTPSKLPYGSPLGCEALRRAVAAVPVPIIAIGGIDTDNATAVRATGCAGLAVIRAILSSDQPTEASEVLAGAR